MRWFRGSAPNKTDPVSRLTDSIERLQAGIVTSLTAAYSVTTNPADAVLLATCVISYAIAVEPPGADAARFAAANRQLVATKSQELARNETVVEPLSYLYAALTILIAIQSRDPLSEAAVVLGNRATELSLYVPNTYDICGSNDALECISAVHTYAQAYLNDALGR
jgi:hypothetical protein